MTRDNVAMQETSPRVCVETAGLNCVHRVSQCATGVQPQLGWRNLLESLGETMATQRVVLVLHSIFQLRSHFRRHYQMIVQGLPSTFTFDGNYTRKCRRVNFLVNFPVNIQ